MRDGEVIETEPEIIHRVISEEASSIITSMLISTVRRGHGRTADIPGHLIAGKTGTAQIADPVKGGYLEDQYVSSFLAGAPVDQPKVTVVCVVHRPDIALGHHGGTVAANPSPEPGRASL